VSRPVVCVLGAGTAGLEALLAARESMGAGVELRLIAPEREFRYRPMSTASPFRPAAESTVAIADLVAETGAEWIRDSAAAVDQDLGSVTTREGETVSYDYLLVAPGARPRRALAQGHLWERGADPGFFDDTLAGIASGEVSSVGVVVPRGARWPLPAYELALVMGWTAEGTGGEVTLITAEERPLAALGSQAHEAVTRELEAAGVELIAGVEVVDEPRGRAGGDVEVDVVVVPEPQAELESSLVGRPSDPARVRLGAGSRRDFDQLISLPTVDGPHLPGVASDAAGFVEVDENLRVCAGERVWAAGSCIAAALQHGALDAQQADFAIGAIAAEIAGGPADNAEGAPDLTGVLLTGQRERWLLENPPGTAQPSTRCLWWPPGRAVGRMLARRIAAWDPALHSALPEQSGGLPIRAPVALGCSGMPPAGAGGGAGARTARLRDIEMRQMMAVRRRELEAGAQLRELEAGLQSLADRQQAVIRDLQQHGYLTHRGAGAPGPRPPAA